MAGKDGKGTMPFKWTGPKPSVKFGGQRPPMPHGVRGRVLVSSKNKRRGRQESTGEAS